MTGPTTSVRELVLDLLARDDLAVEEAAARHLAPDFRQRVNGQWLSREAFVAGITALRDSVRAVEMTVLDELRDGPHYAERHLLVTTDPSGRRTAHEVFLFALTDENGQFLRIEEVSVEVPLPAA